LVKADLREPLIYLGLLLLLFLARVPVIANRLARLRSSARDGNASTVRQIAA
jgi:DMSO/TMAO reductase YedYZ heme-binding membrane subunit